MQKLIFCFFLIFFPFQTYADYLANHAEVSFFRAKNQLAINAQKAALGTNLDVLGALKVLEINLHNGQITPAEFSKLVLGMMLGNGYKNGVSTALTVSAAERNIFEAIVKRAKVYVDNLQFQADQVWSEQPNAAALASHVGVLNGWQPAIQKHGVKFEFSYEPRVAEPYKTIDQAFNDVCASFSATNPSKAMIEHAQRLSNDHDYGLMLKLFILTFSELSAADQLIITNDYTEEIRGAVLQDAKDAEFQFIVLQCQNKNQALEFIGGKAPLRTNALVGCAGMGGVGGAPVPPLAKKAAILAVPNDDGVDISKINHLLEELRQFDTSSRSGRYADVSKTILIMKTLYEHKDEIINFAKRNWENVGQMRNINSVAHPRLTIRKGEHNAVIS